MKSILLIALANIRRRRLQSFLVGSSVALAVLLFTTALGMLAGMNKPFDQMFGELNASHMLLLYDQRQDATKNLSDWFLAQPEVASVSEALPYHLLEEKAIFREEQIDLQIQLTEHYAGNGAQDHLLILDGANKTHPDMGEIWIPRHLAGSHGIQVGDTLGIPFGEGLIPFVVTATVIDPHYVSGLFNPTRAWIAPGSLLFYLPVSRANDRQVGVRLQTPEDLDAVWSRFNRAWSFDGRMLPYTLFRSVYLTFFQIINLVLLVFSGFAVLAAVFLLSTTLSTAIAADARLVGVYKSLGFTPGNVTAVYLAQYLILALISLPVGLATSFWVTRAILSSLARSIGLANVSMFFWPLALLAGLLFLCMISLVTWTGSRRAGRIKPVDAIRLGGSPPGISGRRLFGREISARLDVPVFLGLRMLLARPKRLIQTGFTLVMTVFIITFSINIAYSFARLGDNKPAWGLEDTDVQILRNRSIALPLEHKLLVQILQQEPRVDSVIPYGYGNATIPARAGKAARALTGKIYEGDPSQIGLRNLEGRHPGGPDEIALCLLTAREFGKQSGDTLAVQMEGQQRLFVITGIYQDVSTLGHGFRLSAIAKQSLNPLFEPDHYGIKLRHGVSAQSFQGSLQALLGETVQVDLSIEDRKGITATIAGMRGSLLLVSLFFLVILMVVLLNDEFTTVHECRRAFGMLKTIGVTSVQNRLVLVYKTAVLTAIGLVAGIPLALVLSPILISALASGIGLEIFPYLTDRWGTLLVIPGLLFFTIASTWLASRKVLRIRPRLLIAE